MKNFSGILQRLREEFVEVREKLSELKQAKKDVEEINLRDLNNIKINRELLLEFLDVFKSDNFSLKILDSMLNEFKLVEDGQEEEDLVRFDYYLLILKKATSLLIKNENSELFSIWEESKNIINDARRILAYMEYFKEGISSMERPRWLQAASGCYPKVERCPSNIGQGGNWSDSFKLFHFEKA